MHFARFIVSALVIGCASLLLPACDKSGSNSGTGSGASSGSGSGFSGTYTSTDDVPMTIEFKSGGSVVMTAEGMGSSSGTYTVDGDKIIVSIDNQKHTFIRDGNCIEEQRNIFGKLCKGGKAGEAANASSSNVPTAPAGTYIATNEDGEFKIEFAPDNKITMSVIPTVGKPYSKNGSFVIEGNKFYATLEPGTSMVLTYVNNAYESSAFGLPMKFIKQ